MPTTAPGSPSVANTVSGFGPNIAAGTPWQTALLQILDAPQTPQNYLFLNQWFRREHNDPPGQMFADNPFFTTAGAGGSAGKFTAGMYPEIPVPPAHQHGLAQFPTVAVGVLATAATLTQDGYPHIVAALQSGNPQAYSQGPGGSDLSSELLKWSGSGYSGFSNIQAPSAPTGPAVGQSFPANIMTAGDTGISSKNYPGQGAVKSVEGAVSSTESFVKEISNPLFWLRVAEVVGGVLLVGLGLYLIAKDMGLPTPDLPKKAEGPVDEAAELAAAFETGQRQGRLSQARAAGRQSEAFATPAATESSFSQKNRRLREKAAQIPDDDIPF